MKQIAMLLSVLLLLTACGNQRLPEPPEPTAASFGAVDSEIASAEPTGTPKPSPLPTEASEDTEPEKPTDLGSASEQPADIPKSEPVSAEEEIPVKDTVYLDVGGRRFSITLADNAAAEAFRSLLPAAWDMEELHGNEKFIYLDDSLPADSQSVGYIEAGDLMLYGDSCVVLFYESFSTSYGYTRIGWVDDPTGLEEAVGSEDVAVSFGLG